jgi:phosphatidylserine decarboxylase
VGTQLGVMGLRLVPKNLLSRLAGRLAATEWPGPLQRPLNRAFARLAGVNREELCAPIESFPSLQALFTRALPEGARPLDTAADSLVSPCDGRLGEAGTVKDGQLLQVKGRPYSLADLLDDAAEAERFEGGTYATLYLAPGDYHRFHMPCSGRVVRASYRPGKLWPVNRVGLQGVNRLFAQNERICAYLEVAQAEAAGLLCLVAIGATNVGKIGMTFDDLVTNVSGMAPCLRYYEGGGHAFEKGQEWGRFQFGSTIVLVATPGLVEFDAIETGASVRVGSRIGRLCG